MEDKVKFEVGMKLYDFRNGWGVITELNSEFVEIEFTDENGDTNLWEYDEVEQVFLKPFEYTIEFKQK